jgi:hypothetical protein
MTHVHELLLRFLVLTTAPRARDERGDVPGWVLITVMTAGLVTIIYGVAREELAAILRSALNSVRG